MRNYRVLVVTCENRAGVTRLPQLLHKAGLMVDVLGLGKGDILLSRHIQQTLACKVEDIAAALKRHLAAQAEQYDCVVFGDETALAMLIPHCREDWLKHYFPVCVDGDLPEMVMSKTAFTLAALARGICMPPSKTCQSTEEVYSAAKEIGFPLMLKTDLGTAGLGVRKVKHIEDLHETLKSLPAGPWVVQKFIQGRIGSIQLLLDHGKPHCWYASYKLEVFPIPYGPSTVRHLVEHPDLPKLVEQVAAMTGFNGLCGMDWILDEENHLYLLELNPRPTPGYHVGRFAGVDFSKALRSWITGIDKTPQAPPPPPEARNRAIYMWPQHAKRCIYMGPLWRLVFLLPGIGQNDVNWGEPRLLLHQSVDLLHRLFHTTVARLARLPEKFTKRLRRHPRHTTAMVN